MREIGGLIWVLIVVVAVISSISQSVRRQAAARNQTRSTAGPASPRLANAAPSRSVPVAAAAAPPVPPPVTVPAPRGARAPKPVVRHPEIEPRARSAGALDGMFANRASLVRAIVAAEVLGKPGALRDE